MQASRQWNDIINRLKGNNIVVSSILYSEKKVSRMRGKYIYFPDNKNRDFICSKPLGSSDKN